MALRGSGLGTTAGWSTPFQQSDGVALMPWWISVFHSFDALPGGTRTYGVSLSGGANTLIKFINNGLSGTSPAIQSAGFGMMDESGTQYYSPNTDNYDVGAWGHYILNFYPAGAVTTGSSYYNGNLYGLLSTTYGQFVLNSLSLATGGYASELFAEVCIGRGTVSDVEASRLAVGRNPLNVFDPDRIIRYFPLRDSFSDLGRQRVGARPDAGAPAPMWAAHPPVERMHEDLQWMRATSGGIIVKNRPRILLAA